MVDGERLMRESVPTWLRKAKAKGGRGKGRMRYVVLLISQMQGDRGVLVGMDVMELEFGVQVEVGIGRGLGLGFGMLLNKKQTLFNS